MRHLVVAITGASGAIYGVRTLAALLEAGCRPEIRVVATHALLVGDAAARLARLGLARVVVTDAVPVPPAPGVPLEVVSVAPLLAEAIRRLSSGRPLRELLAT